MAKRAQKGTKGYGQKPLSASAARRKILAFKPKLALKKQEQIKAGILAGKSKRQIAKDVKCDQKTVRRHELKLIADVKHYEEVQKGKRALVGMLELALKVLAAELEKKDSLAKVAIAKWLVEILGAIPSQQEMAAHSDTLSKDKEAVPSEDMEVKILMEKMLGNMVRRDKAMGLKMPELMPPGPDDPYLDKMPEIVVKEVVTMKNKE